MFRVVKSLAPSAVKSPFFNFPQKGNAEVTINSNKHGDMTFTDHLRSKIDVFNRRRRPPATGIALFGVPAQTRGLHGPLVRIIYWAMPGFSANDFLATYFLIGFSPYLYSGPVGANNII